MEKYLVKNFEGNKVEMTMEEINEELKKFPKDLNAPNFTWKTNAQSLIDMAEEERQRKLRDYNLLINGLGVIVGACAIYSLYYLVSSLMNIQSIL